MGTCTVFSINTGSSPNVLLTFPTPVMGGTATLGAVGDKVTYSGTASTASSGFQSVRVSSFTNNTTPTKTYTASTRAPTSVTGL